MHVDKINNIFSLSSKERYDYFVRKVVDFGEVWGLHSLTKGWAIGISDQNAIALLVWPEKDFAQLCASAEHEEYEPRSIVLDDFINKWIPGLECDHRILAIFTTPNGKTVYLSANELYQDLIEELGNYEQ